MKEALGIKKKSLFKKSDIVELKKSLFKGNSDEPIVWEIHEVGWWSRILHFSSYELNSKEF